ncbi:uncharacterized protein LOC62_07G009151 [Vanrija pseudolonga]|uniref:Uncharacterized protein n=1 Tax=Vanrija pseudolonga TaxID=143232 RepID=A0AAF0YI65_9TREE|nr:hypothetical protein LOC62_07G009151 [Vanrija pseudolonga]
MRASLFLLALPLAAASPLVASPGSGDDSISSSSSSSRGKTKASSSTSSASTPTASASETSTDASSAWAKAQPTTASAANSTQAPELVTTAVPSRTSGAPAAGSAGPLKDPAVIWPGADDWLSGATPPLVDFILDNPDTSLLNATLRINPGPITVLALPFYYEAEIDLGPRLKPGTGYTITVNGTGLSSQDFSATSKPFEIKPKGSHIITPPGIGSSLYSSAAHTVPPLTLILGLLLVVLFRTA